MDKRNSAKLLIILVLFLSILLSGNAFADEKVIGTTSGFLNITKTQASYRYATLMKDHKDKLYSVDGKLYYGSIDPIEIEPEYAEYCESSAIYCSLAVQVQRFLKDGKSNYKSYDDKLFDVLFDIDKPSTYKEAKPYFDKVKDLFVADDGSKGIFIALENTKCVTGTFDFQKRNAEFEISNTSDLAKELGISQEALGYILAVFDEYLADIQFDGKRCKVICNPIK